MSAFRLGRYELQSKIAVGGMAEIWLARQAGPAGFTKQLVIKKILPHLAVDKTFVDMFLNEGRLAALINHPNVVQVFELGEEAGNYYLVMEHVPGWSLRAILRRSHELQEPIPHAVTAYLVIGLCLGVHAAHELHDANGQALKLVHRDVSPENVLVSRSGSAKVTDFGIAKATAAASGTRPGETKGKLAYMPPEQLLGKPLDRRADLYAVGAVLHELITGQRAFDVPADAALSLSILKEKPPPLRLLRPDAPAALQAIVDRALEKEAEKRYPDALALAKDLEAFAGSTGEPPSVVASWLERMFPPAQIQALATPVAPTAQLQRAHDAVPTQQEGRATPARRRSSRMWIAPVAGVAVLAVGAAVFAFTRPPPPSPPEATQEPVVVKSPELPPAPAQEPPKIVEPVKPPPEPVKVKPRGKGKLLVRVNPWADVLVDGEMVGATPLSALEVSAGRHSVTVTNSELGKTKTVAVEVRPGRQELVEINLKK
ncbi:MAG: serine/threonine-protein kinase [Myxococcaceae bacterium]